MFHLSDFNRGLPVCKVALCSLRVSADPPAICWKTREQWLAAVSFGLGDVTGALTVTREAMQASDEEGSADHAIRLKAAAQVYDLAGLSRPRDPEPGDATRPVNVTLILTGAEPRALVQAHGVQIHLTGHDPGADR